MTSVNDFLRRGGAAWLRSAGFGPIETPFRTVRRFGGMRLRIFSEGSGGPILLIVPAPIKKGYIWDLMPGRSVVRHALGSGFDVGLIEWTGPEWDDGTSGLEAYAHDFIGTAVAAISQRCRAQSVLLAGHSFGGTLAVIFAAIQPRKVRGLVLVEAPLHFAPGAGALGSLAAALPWAPTAHGAGGPVPGSLISGLGIAADPVEFVTARWLDALASGVDPEALAAHLRVVHWTLDEFAMPARLFSDVAGRLCRDDEFYQGTLTVGGQRAAPDRLDMPVLSVLDAHSRLVPPQSALPVLEETHGPRTLCWHREQAAGAALRHVGALVGRDAHRCLWPSILCWSRVVWEGKWTPGSWEAGRRLA